VTGVQMARMRPVLAAVTQSGSGAPRLAGSGNVGRAARMNHRDIQQSRTMGREKVHLDVSTRSWAANRCNANESVTGLRTCITARAGGDVAANSASDSGSGVATYGVVDIAALDGTTKKASGGGDVRVGASSAEVEVATIDEVAVREVETWSDLDGVQVSSALKHDHS
jgi:hypothetical protein